MKVMKLQILIIAFVLLIAGSAFASLSYDVTINTSSLDGQDAYLYLQYGGINASSSVATVSNFITDGTLAAAPSTAGTLGGSTGTLTTGTGAVTFTNANGTTDYNHGLTLGNTINFILTFSGLTPGGTLGGASTFSVGLFTDEAGAIPLLNVSDPNIAGTGLLVNLANDGSTSATSMDSTATATATPIPAAAWLLGSGLMGLVGIRRKMQN